MLPFLNIGCGTTILPCLQPLHHALVDSALYDYPAWENVDIAPIDERVRSVDLFCYPWPFADECFVGALAAHIIENIPHGMNTILADGWWAFWAELHRVLVPNAIVHLLSPYGKTDGALADPDHKRQIIEHTFLHLMDGQSPFFKARTGNIHFEMVGIPRYDPTPMFAHLAHSQDLFQYALMTQWNVVYNIYVQLKVVK